MKNMVLLLIFAFIFNGCVGDKKPAFSLVKRVGIQVFDDLATSYDLNMIRCVPGKGRLISTITTDYFHNEEVDVMTARFLLHAAVDSYLKKLASDIEIKPFLKNGVISHKNIECTIFFKKGIKDKSAISSISLLGGVVRYNCYDKESGMSKKIHDEKYK